MRALWRIMFHVSSSTDGASLAPGMAPEACSISSNYFDELEPRYGIEP